MTRVKRRPALLIAILLYVSLDLSLPTMPGAFVFDAGDSIESTQSRARAAVETVTLPAPVRDLFVLSWLALQAGDRPTPVEWLERRPVPRWRAGTLDEPAPPSEDPH